MSSGYIKEKVDAVVSALETGDPETQRWFLVSSNVLPFVICSVYTLFVLWVGPAIMKNRKPFHLRSIMVVFNFIIVAVYTSAILTVATNMPRLGFVKVCKGVPILSDKLAYRVVSWLWIIYILKYVELLDTVFFVLRKKHNQVTYLHVLHHNCVILISWVLFKRESNGFMTIPALLNGFVHVIMYSYYGLAALGPHMNKYLTWKKYLTLLQIAQFMLMVLWILVVSPMIGCSSVSKWQWFDVTVILYFYYLFYKFYRGAYVEKGKKVA